MNQKSINSRPFKCNPETSSNIRKYLRPSRAYLTPTGESFTGPLDFRTHRLKMQRTALGEDGQTQGAWGDSQFSAFRGKQHQPQVVILGLGWAVLDFSFRTSCSHFHPAEMTLSPCSRTAARRGSMPRWVVEEKSPQTWKPATGR